MCGTIHNLSWASAVVACVAFASPFIAPPAQAASLVLGTSGWTATYPDEVTLTVQGEDASTIYVRKVTAYVGLNTASITFEQTSATALPQIGIESEALTNSSGGDWTQFNWVIDDSEGEARFNEPDSRVGQADGFTINPFTTFDFTDGLNLKVSGGVIPAGVTFTPGSAPADGSLLILAAPNAQATGLFTVNATPFSGNDNPVIPDQPTPPPAAIPLPTAFWSGGSCLALLGTIGMYRMRRRHRRQLQ